MPGTLPSVDQPTGARSIPCVPLTADGEHVDVAVRVTASHVVVLEPYRFSESQEVKPACARNHAGAP